MISMCSVWHAIDLDTLALHGRWQFNRAGTPFRASESTAFNHWDSVRVYNCWRRGVNDDDLNLHPVIACGLHEAL